MEQPSVARKLARGFGGNLKFILVFLAAILFLFLGLYSQTQITLRESRARDFEPVSRNFTHSTGEYILAITHPKFLLLENAEKSRAPITIQLSQVLPLPTPTSSLVTPASTSPAISTQPLFIVTLSSTSDIIEFTDKEGLPLVSRIVLTPTLSYSASAVIYLHQSTSVTRPDTAEISVQVADESGKPLLPLFNFQIALESGEALFGSRLCELAGTTSTFLSLIAALWSVGWKLWEKEQQARETREQEAREQEQKAREQREREQKEREQKEKERQEQERQEYERQRQTIETALSKVESLQALLDSNLSEAARFYWEYSRRTDFPWQEDEVRNRLQSIWTLNAPRELQNLITLRFAFPQGWTDAHTQIGTGITAQSLIWAWRILDENWQQQIRPMLDEPLLKKIEASQWQAILKPWRQICFWKSGYSSTSPDVAKALELLELQRNPFGSEQAEQDELLFETWVDWAWPLETPQTQIIVGKQGSGKTALALGTVRASVCAKTAFPIYVSDCPTEPTRRAQLNHLARATARTLLHFVAFYPRSFLEQDIASRSAIAYLLGVYIGVGKDLSLQFQKAGLEPIGEGKRMLQELERLLLGASLTLPPEDEMIAMLSTARPHGFPYTIILADLPEVSPITASTLDDTARALLDLSTSFHGEPLYLKIFLPTELNALALNNDVIRLEWSEKQLQTLLGNRLGIAVVKSLNAWCNPEAANSDPDQHLIQAAQGLPGRLIYLGNKLFARLAAHSDYPKITVQDLDDVLGKL
jgi:hypothetical protein